jgi:hypothetical protein
MQSPISGGFRNNPLSDFEGFAAFGAPVFSSAFEAVQDVPGHYVGGGYRFGSSFSSGRLHMLFMSRHPG